MKAVQMKANTARQLQRHRYEAAQGHIVFSVTFCCTYFYTGQPTSYVTLHFRFGETGGGGEQNHEVWGGVLLMRLLIVKAEKECVRNNPSTF